MPDEPQTVVAMMAELNRVVHEPARLAILTVLASCDDADFQFLESATGLSKGNLSVQLSNLEAAGLVAIEKGMRGRRPWTKLMLTATGRVELERYWNKMERIRDAASSSL